MHEYSGGPTYGGGGTRDYHEINLYRGAPVNEDQTSAEKKMFCVNIYPKLNLWSREGFGHGLHSAELINYKGA